MGPSIRLPLVFAVAMTARAITASNISRLINYPPFSLTEVY